MKILELQLRAFGPFTQHCLDLSAGEQGLHVVYGPNEAGKSSALRALKALLYGIPDRTADNFVHPNDQLRLGGRLRLADGSELAFLRRKGRKHTLLSADETPLAESVLTPFLQGVGAELFETLFGIDHEALVRGGQEILEQKGEVGQALFSAGLGTADLRKVLKELDEQAQALFLPRGTNPSINAAIKAYRDTHKRLKETALSSREWDQHHKALAAATRELNHVEEERDRLVVERNRLKRIQAALPYLANRQELLKRLEAFEGVVVLSDDFSRRRLEAQKALDTARELQAKAASRLYTLKAKASEVRVSQTILDQAESIEDLYQRLGSHRKALQDRPQREGERGQLIADAEALLRDLRPELSLAQAENLRPALARRRRIQALGNRHQTLIDRIKQTGGAVGETTRKLNNAQDALQGLPPYQDPTHLRRAVEAARKTGELDNSLRDVRADLTAQAAQCRIDLERLGLWSGSLDALETLPVPALESIDRFESDFQDLYERRKRLQERQDETRNEWQDLEGEIEAIRLAGAVPDEVELTAGRARRDQGWRLLRRRWIDAEDVAEEAAAFDAERALPEAYEQSVSDADEIADRLRREADRVHKQASLVAQRKHCEESLARLEFAAQAHGIEVDRLQEHWLALWAPCGLMPLSPREMRAWMARQEKLREKALQLRELRFKVQGLETTITAHRQTLAAEFVALGEDEASEPGTLEPLLARSEAVLARMEETARARGRLQEAIKELEQNLADTRAEANAAAADRDQWLADWAESVRDLGLDGDAGPSEAHDVLEGLGQIFAKLHEAEQLGKRIEGIDKDAQHFRADARLLAERVAPELTRLPTEQIIVQLNALLTRNRTNDTRREEWVGAINGAEKEIEEAKATIGAMEARLTALAREAGCETVSELEQAEEVSRAFLVLKKELFHLEEQLLAAGEGASIEVLKKEAEAVDVDALPGQIDQLTKRIEAELEPEIKRLSETKGAEKSELQRMNGSAQAAEAAEQAQAILAGLGADVERYVRLKLAARILHQEIERYRSANQGPLVSRASEHFAALTLGSFAGLRTDFDEQDEPVLVGLRPDESPVRVAGMSSGTRDQLYLALRLATLEKYLQSSEPLPFIVDDILIHFDDARSAATLKVLADLAAQTQVILFTHHSRLLQEARKLDGKAGVLVHELA